MSANNINSDYSDATLILAAHGSTLNAESSSPAFKHADELRRRGAFADVVECFWKLEPFFRGALRSVFTARAFVVPLFISEGYFTEEILPREFGFSPNGKGGFVKTQQRGSQIVHYCGPVGTHPSMTEVLLARARDVVTRFPSALPPEPRDAALFIAGHGTGNNENSRKAIEQQADLIRARNIYAEAHPLFMEEAPRIGDCYSLTAAKHLIIVPFFISDGLHSHEDIPVMLGEPREDVTLRYHLRQPTWINPTERNGKLVWYTPSIGSEPHIADVILERVAEASGAAPV